MWKFGKQFIKDNPQTILGIKIDSEVHNYIEWLESKLEKFTIILEDKNGNPIKIGQRFKFKFMKELHNHIELIGSFSWNNDELRYEIDILDNDEYACLSYVSNGVMYDFELIA